MILVELFFEFFKIGLFTFGGAYAAIPIIRDSALSQGWLSEEMLGNVIAISESTPGPIMVNAATYIGSCQAGVAGAIVATLGVILPSFIIILIVAKYMRKWIEKPGVQAILGGIKPAIAGIILSTGLWMAIQLLIPITNGKIDYHTLIIMSALCIIIIVWKLLKRKMFSPILLIVIAAILGTVIY